jgi:hypothetical protein
MLLPFKAVYDISHGRIILKWSSKMGCIGVDWIDLDQDRDT